MFRLCWMSNTLQNFWFCDMCLKLFAKVWITFWIVNFIFRSNLRTHLSTQCIVDEVDGKINSKPQQRFIYININSAHIKPILLHLFQSVFRCNQFTNYLDFHFWTIGVNLLYGLKTVFVLIELTLSIYYLFLSLFSKFTFVAMWWKPPRLALHQRQWWMHQAIFKSTNYK